MIHNLVNTDPGIKLTSFKFKGNATVYVRVCQSLPRVIALGSNIYLCEHLAAIFPRTLAKILKMIIFVNFFSRFYCVSLRDREVFQMYME